jgi:dihydroorotase
MDLAVEGKIYHHGNFEDGCIGIRDGKINEIKKIIKADKKINFKNKLILPSGIDLHVHFRDPGMVHKENFYTGSLSAAFGGITCIMDMPNTVPHTLSSFEISSKIRNAEKKSVIDFGVYAGINNNNIVQIEELAKKCNGFKIYLGNTTLNLLFDKKNLHEAFELIGLSGKPVLIHAEDEECMIRHHRKESSLYDHMRIRPSVCEEISIKDIYNAISGINTKVHICHISSCEGLDLLKNRPINITCGVTPHHSLLSINRNLISPTFYKVNPPIRTSFDKEALFNGIKNGMIDILESDHAPHTIDEKNLDFEDAPSGVPGVETVYPLFMYLAKKEILSYQRVIDLLCNKPAEIIGVNKGKLLPGFDADFIVIDTHNEVKIKSEKLHSKCGWSPFEDSPAIFPEYVFIRGEKIIEENEIQVERGYGKFIGA